MTIHGKILHIRETWPLQLVVDAGGRRHEVTMRDDTRVVRHGAAVDPGALRPGLTVEVSGDGGPAGIVASAIVLV